MKILICDKHPHDAKLLQLILQDRGHETAEAASAGQMIRHLMLKTVVLLIVDPDNWTEKDLEQVSEADVPRKAFWSLQTAERERLARWQVDRIFDKATEIGKLLNWIEQLDGQGSLAKSDQSDIYAN